MSDLEGEISQVMAEHDDEAPRAADLLRSLEQTAAPRRRRAGWYRAFPAYLPFAAAAAVVAVVAGSVWAGGFLAGHRPAPGPAPAPVIDGRGRVLPLSCPARYAGQAPWVPARPAGVSGGSRLVPPQTPSSAMLCAYLGSNTAKQQAGWALSGRRSLAGGLAELADQLTWEPRSVPGQEFPCTDMAGLQTNYLIGLTYPGGATIWVAATNDPNFCVASSNGEFTSYGVVGPEASQAFAAGRWPTPRPATRPGSCTLSSQGSGRLGQDTVMVPAGSTSLTICAPKAHTLTSGYQELVSALNRLPTFISTRSCSPTEPSETSYQLVFSYPQGPQVLVNITSGCKPAIDNLSLQSNSASSILPVLQQLLKPK